ncbi:Lipoprotein-releasing system ATP-binding protein LolD [uncultured Alphaproteobacteria bacterium]|uniref:Lipoprotein-releasing system ATP-binding protein LolD n=1 Tax=uncultured Alphaproteobacteria bacterium TaxID=91750 RepID=A0A212IVZ1_9PROT|nr:Lipoprotein-releasing system ATP-binding protein LolD [uncultured Alphaproteobacteria bacterium]
MVIELTDVAIRRGGKGGFLMSVPKFAVAAGEAVAITGASGSGKSTVLDALGLVLRPEAAAGFRCCGADAATLWRADDLDGLAAARAAGIGYILQTGGLLPFLSVRENIGLSPSLLGQKDFARHVAMLVEALGLGPHLAKMPAQLSIGERQRAAIARALAHRPALLLADEPTASLDPVNAGKVLDLLLGLVKGLGTALVLVSHDWSKVASLGLRRYATASATAGGWLAEVAS